MNTIINLKPIPNIDTHNCFGCGPNNITGLRMKFFTNEKIVVSNIIIPGHLCGWDNIVHGGVITTSLDEVMAWSVIYFFRKFMLTKNISIDFIRPTYTGREMRAEGRILEQTKENEALMEGKLFDSDGRLCAKSTGKFALMSYEAACELGIMDKHLLAEFNELIKTFDG